MEEAAADAAASSLSMPRMERLIAILAKEPVPGRVKTRLAKHVGAAQAAALAKAFLLDTIDVALRVPDATVLLAIDPPNAEPWFRTHAPARCELMVQPEGDLGGRIQAAFDWAFSRGAGAALAMGMDSPQVESARLAEALDAARGGSVTLGPSIDGGYYLIGMDRPRPTLFEGIDWSTDAVLTQTLARVTGCGARAIELTEEHDVDDLLGLQALEHWRLGPRSRAALEALPGSWQG